jgi:hypothetical protein
MDEERDEVVPPRADGETDQSDEERVRAVIDELRRLKVEDLALDMAVSLVTVGYQKLGLTDQTRELRDLAGARLAIELLRASLDVLEREGAGSKLGDLRGTLAAMQLNYARAAAESPAGPSESPAGPVDGPGDAEAAPARAAADQDDAGAPPAGEQDAAGTPTA